MVTNRVGPPVTGDDFFDREREQAQVWDFLERDHLLLLAPRRVGKTSLMQRLQESAAARGFHATYCSVADAADEEAFLERLLHAIGNVETGRGILHRLSEGAIGRFLRRVKKMEVVGSGVELDVAKEATWTQLAEILVRALNRQEGKWLLLVDEMPVFLLALTRLDSTGARARHFLNWFRTLRQEVDFRQDLRWLLAGSIGLDTVTARLRVGDTINDLHLFHLGPFSPEVADDLLKELARSHEIALAQDVRAHMIRKVGWLIPFHLQLLFSELRALCSDRQGEPSVERVEEAFAELLKPAKRGYFDYWRQRLEEELGRPDSSYAVELLNAAAQDETGVSRATLSQLLERPIQDALDRAEKLRFVLDVLESDGYLVADEGRYRFRSPLLRQFWLERVVP